ncbi:MAG TPA: DUF885 domain-containing protein [Thermoanaerobaculia bacterium]|jgi:uncharacterized protein (DUF885 family)|nr:DUF885 domain-containing protein [Thermoanaerobaculia bacterium]
MKRFAFVAALLIATSSFAAPKKASPPMKPLTPAELHAVAHDYYEWQKKEYPVSASDQGFHAADDKLDDFSPAAIARNAAHVRALLDRVRAANVSGWAKDDDIDWLLFRSQLERDDFPERVQKPEETDPQVYVGEASNAIFSLLKKDYAPARTRALAATARLKAMPAMIEQAERNLKNPVRLYAQLAIDSARSIDPLFSTSLMTIAGDLSADERTSLDAAREEAVAALHGFADWLEQRLPQMTAWKPMGEANYNYMLRHILLLPMDSRDVAHLGEVELGRYRALEAMLSDPSMADPNPARVKNIPPDQQAFLAAYESREQEMIDFLKARKLVTLPAYLGPFQIRQLPEAFKPTSPGGFMNPPGIYDADDGGFYFIPTYNPQSQNFYIRAAIEDPRPLLGHEGIPGHFLQISIANHLQNEIRRHHAESVFIEGWALYTEEMLVREGMYAPESAGAAQVLRLARYRAARIGVDVNLHTGRWPFERGVSYFMDGGGLDKEAAEGEAAGAASSPTQKISYITGKWQIMRLLGRYRDAKGADFRLGQFHDDLIAHGSLPVSILTWILLDDPSEIESVTGMKLGAK